MCRRRTCDAEGVERGNLRRGVVGLPRRGARRLSLAAVEQRHRPLLHFAGGLAGERDGENALGRRAVADEVGDAVGDDPRLAGAGAGQHQQRPAQRLDGVVLGGVEHGGRLETGGRRL